MNGAGVSLVRDKGPAAPAQDKMGWPPFLMRRGGKKPLSYTPTAAKWLPRENFCWCSRPLPHPPSSIHSSLSLLLNLHLRLQCNSSWGAKVLLLWRLQSRVHSVCFFFVFFSFLWPPAQEPDERLHHRETAESNQRQELFHKIKSIFLTVLWGLTSVRKYVHLYPWKSKKYSCPALPLSWFRMGRCNLWLMSGVSGRKEEREETSALDVVAVLTLRSDFCPVCMFVNLSCPGRLFIYVAKCPLQHCTSVQCAISFGKTVNVNCQRIWARGSQGKGRSDHLMDLMLSSGWHWQCDLRLGLKAKQASEGRSSGKSLFIPLGTKTLLLWVTHNKCFLSGGNGW